MCGAAGGSDESGANNSFNMTKEQLAEARRLAEEAESRRLLQDGSPAPPALNDSAILALICGAGEFEHVKVREEEIDELDKLRKKVSTVGSCLDSCS